MKIYMVVTDYGYDGDSIIEELFTTQARAIEYVRDLAGRRKWPIVEASTPIEITATGTGLGWDIHITEREVNG